jgi:hypothetical protein
MAAKIAENTARLVSIKEPWRARLGVETVRAGAEGLHDATNGTIRHEMSGMDGTFGMNPFIEIDHVFAPGFVHRTMRLIQLFQGGERRFVREVVLARPQYAAPKGPMLAWHSRGNY